MIFTRFLKVTAYAFAILFAFGVATQMARFRSLTQQQAIAVQRKNFSDLLQRSNADAESGQKLAAAYNESLDDYEYLLIVASRFMAGATTVVAGLLSIIAALWCRLRLVTKHQISEGVQT